MVPPSIVAATAMLDTVLRHEIAALNTILERIRVQLYETRAAVRTLNPRTPKPYKSPLVLIDPSPTDP